MSDIVSNVKSGVATASAARRRRALVRLRIVWTSCKTVVGQRWWGSVCLLHGVPALSGNMIVAMRMASSRMVCMYVARESMETLSPSISPTGSAVLDGLGESPRLVSFALAFAIPSDMGEWESIATWNF